jgi:hypothetical protein
MYWTFVSQAQFSHTVCKYNTSITRFSCMRKSSRNTKSRFDRCQRGASGGSLMAGPAKIYRKLVKKKADSLKCIMCSTLTTTSSWAAITYLIHGREFRPWNFLRFSTWRWVTCVKTGHDCFNKHSSLFTIHTSRVSLYTVRPRRELYAINSQ